MYSFALLQSIFTYFSELRQTTGFFLVPCSVSDWLLPAREYLNYKTKRPPIREIARISYVTSMEFSGPVSETGLNPVTQQGARVALRDIGPKLDQHVYRARGR